jgi:hypothetical protein
MCTGIFGLGFGEGELLAEDEAGEDEDPDAALEPLLTVPDGVPDVLLVHAVRKSASTLTAASTGVVRRTEVRRSTPPRYGTPETAKCRFQVTPTRAAAG